METPDGEPTEKMDPLITAVSETLWFVEGEKQQENSEGKSLEKPLTLSGDTWRQNPRGSDLGLCPGML